MSNLKMATITTNQTQRQIRLVVTRGKRGSGRGGLEEGGQKIQRSAFKMREFNT